MCARACMWEGIGGNIIIARVPFYCVFLALLRPVWEPLVRLDIVAWNPSPNICRSFTTSDSNNPLCCNGLFVWRLSFSFPSVCVCGWRRRAGEGQFSAVKLLYSIGNVTGEETGGECM